MAASVVEDTPCWRKIYSKKNDKYLGKRVDISAGLCDNGNIL
jgi:hypothetical protein